ncbi:hypothetical protein NKR19_g2882 [Coniochaeta hoffmannii]|uniref:Transcription factor RfeG n=1 Tax=Coniochaeta hoffmannii TaxID=91930 RepID=A0AA38SFU5_9PEZI|nr:hypothetical protein NKR19_g2882 [Coniochaeta hoffmannii]
MAGRHQRTNAPPPTASAGSARQNEYFVPRDGIDREVITADICRYLGNDALVRPGTYEHPDGRVTQGYYITAYRNLTSAMIQDLKADSARWDAERRAASRGQPGAAGAPSRGNDGYRNSETHYQRQHYGPTSADPAYGDAMAVDPPSYNPPPMRYPGTGNSGYNGVNSAYAAQQQRYEAQQNAYNSTAAVQYGAPAQQSYSPAPQAPDMYATGMPAGAAGMVPQPAFGQPPNVPDSQYVRGAAYQNSMNPMVTTSVASRSMYPTAAPVYAAQADYGYSQPVGVSGAATGYAQPIDARYGRASSAGNQAQTGGQTTSSTSTGRRDRDRDRDQDRHRREDRDRDTDRHAAERHARRHGGR